jgi:hypothetical protein
MHRETVPQVQWPSRAEHQHFIFEGLPFPASKEDLVEFITDAEVDTDTMNLVLALPDRMFRGTDDIWRAISEGIRVMHGQEGSPRDDMGKEAVLVNGEMHHP